MSKKPIYKCWWFWLITMGAFLLFVCNILLAHFYKSEGANIFTAVSGWVSGIATIILGVIAVFQNKKYKDENNRVLAMQNEENTRLINEQKDLAWRNLQYQLYSYYLSTLRQSKKVLFQYDFFKIHNNFLSLEATNQSYVQIIFEKNMLLEELKSILNFLLSSKYFIDDKDLVYEYAQNYFDNVKKYVDFIFEQKYTKCAQLFHSKSLTKEQSELKSQIMSFGEKGRDMRNKFQETLSKHITNLYEFIDDIYYLDTEKLKEKLNLSEHRFTEWSQNVIRAKEQNNG